VSPATFSRGEKDYINSNEHSAWKQMLMEAPIAPQAKVDSSGCFAIRSTTFRADFHREESEARKRQLRQFFKRHCKSSRGCGESFQAVPQPLFGLGIDAVAAQDAWGFDMPDLPG